MSDYLQKYEPVIGLEVHCQLATDSKLFCSCSTKFGKEPNRNTCEVCLGLPGSLPVLNSLAVDFAIRFALAVSAKIKPSSVFARKQYFYPDLPKGYQISQYDKPFCENGFVDLNQSSQKRIRIQRAHIEEDAGKNIHTNTLSYVDLNRAGIPLLEIVTEPDLNSAAEAVEYFKKIYEIVTFTKICDGNLENGSLRCDANVSIRKKGDTKLGTRCEIKNLNSFKHLEKAISYEIVRQIDMIENNKTILQQTMGFDPTSGKTMAQRTKEDSDDYRYFPDPDLKKIIITANRIEKIKATLPELPEEIYAKYSSQHGVQREDLTPIFSDFYLKSFFEEAIIKNQTKKIPIKKITNWLNTEVLAAINQGTLDHNNKSLTSERLLDLIQLIEDGKISGKIAKTVFKNMLTNESSPGEIVKSLGLEMVSDENSIREQIKSFLANNQDQVSQFHTGQKKVLGFFVGNILKNSGGKMNPQLVNKILLEELNEQKE